MTWYEAQRIPWGILILFGGGIALAGGFTASGLSEWLGENLAALHGIPGWLFVFTIAVLVTFLTEITSNVATASIFMPIMGGLAVGVGLHPYILMLPATLSSSCAFMLPVATPAERHSLQFRENKNGRYGKSRNPDKHYRRSCHHGGYIFNSGAALRIMIALLNPAVT